MGNRQSRSRHKLIIERDECELLIIGYLKNIIGNRYRVLPSYDICSLCRQYYLIPQLLFLNDAAFHVINITSPNLPIISTNLVNTNQASINPKPFDVSCYIPNILKNSTLLQLGYTHQLKTPRKMAKARSLSALSNMTRAHSYDLTPTMTAVPSTYLPSTHLTLKPSSDNNLNVSDDDHTRDLNARYDAIFTRRLKWVQTKYKHLQSSIFLYF